jgi:hypothetical protein
MCVQAMSLMLPKNTPRRQIPDANTLESKMDCMKITSSYSCAALNNVQLDSILDDIKGNLRKEQRTVMELNYTTMHKVLTPIQVLLRVPSSGLPAIHCSQNLFAAAWCHAA